MSMKADRSVWKPALVAAIALAAVLAGCNQFVLYSKFSPPPALPLAIKPAVATVDVASTLDFVASGGVSPYSYGIAAGGGTIGQATGVYTAPNTAGSAAITVTDGSGATSVASVTVAAASAALLISPTSLTITINVTYQFTATGGVTPYTFSLYSGSASGSVTASGLFTATSTAGTALVRVTDAAGSTSDATVSVVSGGSLAISPATPSVAEGGTITFVGAGGTPLYTFSVFSGVGAIGATSGLYTAPSGTVGINVATVQIRDSVSAIATTTVDIVPATPSNLAAVSPAVRQMQLTWQNNTTVATGIQIWRQGGTPGFTLLTTLPATATSYLDTGLTPNTLYSYYLIAVDTTVSPNVSSADSNQAYGID